MKENFINRTSKTVIAFLAAIVVAGFIPMTQAHAARADASSIRLVNNGKASFITGEQKTEVYYGNFKQTKNQDGSFKTEPIKWRVLKNTNEKAFLLADQNLDTRKFNETNNQQTNITWTDSSIRAWLNGTGDYTEDSFVKDAFVSGEKAAVAQTETADNNQVSVSDDASIKDKVFLLSVDEAMDQDSGFTNSTYSSEKRQAKNTDYAASKRTQTGNDWWLRTQGKFNNSPINNSTACIYNSGYVSRYGGSNGTLRGIRPAMNLDMKAVLFASSADQGKASGEEGADALVENNGTLSDQVKMTLKDDGTIEGLDDHKDFVVHPCEVTYDSGKKEVTIPYKNAVTGDNEYISAVVTDKPITEEDAVVKYYGRIAKASDENGASVKINTDGKMESGDHLYVFNEQYNGDRQTDFASGMKEISIPPVSHNLVKTNKADATCTEDGHEAYWTCDHCHKLFSDENGENEISEPVKIPAKHDLKKTDKKNPTCTKNGYEAYWTCDHCHKLFSDANGKNEISEPNEIAATGHKWKKATCTEPMTCAVCKKKSGKATGHKWSAWKVTKKATYKTKGQKQRVCKNDPTHIQKKTIPELKVKGVLIAKMTSNGKTKANIAWNKINGADGYEVFFANCGKKKIDSVKTINNNKTFKWTKSGLKKHTTYRTIVKAFIIKGGKKEYVKSSPCAHAYTTNGTKNYTNSKKVIVEKANVSLKTKKTHKIKATVVGYNESKKLMPEVHAPKIRYISTNNKIATVTKSGLIEAKSKGECKVYAYAVNGAKAAITVTVK